MATDLKEIKIRLEVLRREIRKEGISYGELLELQSYAEHIDKNDVEFRSNVSHLSQLHLPQLKQSKPIQQPFVSYRRSHQYMLV